jgi:hypothetical protein
MIESEIVAPGSLKGVLSGKHYNRRVRAHKMIYEAMERLRFQAFEKTLSTLEKGDVHAIDINVIIIIKTLFIQDKNLIQYN